MAMGMTMLALTLAGIGTGTSAIGQIRAGKAANKANAAAGVAQKEAAESQAQLADYNAGVAELQAQDAVARGAQDESRFRQGIRQVIGSQRAGLAAGNVDVGFGSSVDVQADAAFLGELDALTIRTNATREAWGYKVTAEDSRRRAEILRKEGAAAAAAGNVKAGGQILGPVSTIIGGAGSLLEARYGFGKKKA